MVCLGVQRGESCGQVSLWYHDSAGLPKELWVVRLDKEEAVLKDGMLEEAVDAVPIVDFLGESPVVIM